MDATEVRRRWAERTGEYSPAYYAGYGPDDWSEAVRRHLERHVAHDADVLELGCSAGRHLANLHAHGFDSLTGIDVNEAAFEVLRSTYPDLAESGTFLAAPLEGALPDLPTDGFDAVYSVETLQHIHPDSAWVFEDVARVAGEVLVTVENEGEAADGADQDPAVAYVDDGVPLYHRDWGAVFTSLDLDQVAVDDDGRDTVRVFRKAED